MKQYRDKGHLGWTEKMERAGEKLRLKKRKYHESTQVAGVESVMGGWKENGIRERRVQKEKERKLCQKMTKDSQHEVLLPAGQVAPDSDGCALHILYF